MIYDYEYFKKEIYSLTTIDLNAYKAVSYTHLAAFLLDEQNHMSK